MVVLVKYDFVALVVSAVCLVCSNIGKTVACKCIRVPIIRPSVIQHRHPTCRLQIVLRAHTRTE